MTIEIKWENDNLGCRTIDPTSGFKIDENIITLYNYIPYRSQKHNITAETDIMENNGNTILLKVTSIDWITGQKYPYTTKGCFLIQKTIEKYNKVHLSVDRVPCSKNTIAEAINYLTPAEVKKAAKAGRKIKRQGDFFFVEMQKKSNLTALKGGK